MEIARMTATELVDISHCKVVKARAVERQAISQVLGAFQPRSSWAVSGLLDTRQIPALQQDMSFNNSSISFPDVK